MGTSTHALSKYLSLKIGEAVPNEAASLFYLFCYPFCLKHNPFHGFLQFTGIAQELVNTHFHEIKQSVG